MDNSFNVELDRHDLPEAFRKAVEHVKQYAKTEFFKIELMAQAFTPTIYHTDIEPIYTYTFVWSEDV